MKAAPLLDALGISLEKVEEGKKRSRKEVT
jgi:hypothetical protein